MPVDYSRYHPKWRLISRLIRFHRAKGRCEHCGAVHLEPHPITSSKVVLTTAHLDQDVTNNRFWNLKALCQRCHFAHDRQDNARRRKYGKYYLDNQITLC
ncbi:hypothetical protein [Tellurirhabdus bombi]|uniref:hypothetical protein n=1 Tax=Tellurirhabdus bombi TaxID=2907205 RepID=UPI001F23109B|nr:hypothetical protein [Tellurirhabdus bombi]